MDDCGGDTGSLLKFKIFFEIPIVSFLTNTFVSRA